MSSRSIVNFSNFNNFFIFLDSLNQFYGTFSFVFSFEDKNKAKSRNITKIFYFSSFNVASLGNLNFLINSTVLNSLRNFIVNFFVGFFFKYIVRFEIVGYHYIIRFSKFNNIMKLKLGFKYRVNLRFPSTIRFINEKRKFVLLGEDFFVLKEISTYIRNLRNLYPYKRKGIVFNIENLKLKVGKKAKLR